MLYVKSLPINDPCNVFILHDNANITYAQNETFNMLDALLQLQPQSSSGGGASREEVTSRQRLSHSTTHYNQWLLIK